MGYQPFICNKCGKHVVPGFLIALGKSDWTPWRCIKRIALKRLNQTLRRTQLWCLVNSTIVPGTADSKRAEFSGGMKSRPWIYLKSRRMDLSQIKAMDLSQIKAHGSISNQGHGSISNQGRGSISNQGHGSISNQGRGSISNQGHGSFSSNQLRRVVKPRNIYREES